jgi:DNA-binding GntR family transcriptional regulator
VLFGSIKIHDQLLADHFGVSRTVTKDVLARMHSVGLITKDKSGHWIAERITQERISDLFEIRSILEPHALRRAAQFITRQELEAAQQNLRTALGKSPIESTDFDRTETDLHIRLLAHCPNEEITNTLRRTNTLFAPTRHLADPFLGIPMELINVALNEHLVIIDHMLDNNVNKASVKLADHILLNFYRYIIHAIYPYFIHSHITTRKSLSQRASIDIYV